MTYNFTKKEMFRSIIKVYVNGNLFHKNIDITATVIENNWFLVDKTGKNHKETKSISLNSEM